MIIVHADPDYLAHYGILGMKWGVRRYQNPDGTLTEAGKRRKNRSVFVSGSSKTEFADSGYYRKDLPKAVSDKLDSYMKTKTKILVGDAPGIDRQVQNYLAAKGYRNVEIFGPGNQSVRYVANPKWKATVVDNPDAEPGTSEWLAAKDKVMSNKASEGLAVILDHGSSATRKNIQRLLESSKSVSVYELSQSGPQNDRWVDDVVSTILDEVGDKQISK